jgi:serine/threonine protein kinase
MVGQHIAHYEILEKIGEGGMGVLYKARDHKLERFVALKLLPGGSEPSAEAAHRFEQEAEAVSALEHPHIAAMHDRGEFDGKPYVVFEYLPGGSLREKIQRARESGQQIPLDDVLRYGVEIGAGLAHAHRKGVIHRDLKPENVLLTDDGSAKVSDFGLALWGDAARITGAGKTLESAAYASPEHSHQLPIDQRSDIFSFGVLLYELASGEPPFRGEYAAAVVYDVVNTPTPPLRRSRPETPEALDQILQKATAKEPAERYRNMGELLEDLREVWNDPTPVRSTKTTQPAARPGSPQRKPQRGRSSRPRAAVAAAVATVVLLAALAFYRSRQASEPAPESSAPPADAAVSIAVLPFENLSRNPEEAYLADGITEELITSLAKIPSLRVIARTSVMRYRQGGKTARAIGEELKVTRVVEGSVLHAGGQIRVTAQLIDTATEDHLWAESYQRNLVDVLSLQQDIASAIAAIADGAGEPGGLCGLDPRPDSGLPVDATRNRGRHRQLSAGHRARPNLCARARRPGDGLGLQSDARSGAAGRVVAPRPSSRRTRPGARSHAVGRLHRSGFCAVELRLELEQRRAALSAGAGAEPGLIRCAPGLRHDEPDAAGPLGRSAGPHAKGG